MLYITAYHTADNVHVLGRQLHCFFTLTTAQYDESIIAVVSTAVLSVFKCIIYWLIFLGVFLCIFSFSSRCPFQIWFGWHSVGGLSLLYNIKHYLDT